MIGSPKAEKGIHMDSRNNMLVVGNKHENPSELVGLKLGVVKDGRVLPHHQVNLIGTDGKH